MALDNIDFNEIGFNEFTTKYIKSIIIKNSENICKGVELSIFAKAPRGKIGRIHDENKLEARLNQFSLFKVGSNDENLVEPANNLVLDV